jgi:hypothetical protein
MNIKDKRNIKIGYQNYELDFWPETFARTEQAEGEFFAKDQKIGVRDNDLDKVHGANTVLHEVLHGVVYQYGLCDIIKENEERLVNTMANGLMSVFVDNPWLLDYFKTSIENQNYKNVGITFGTSEHTASVASTTYSTDFTPVGSGTIRDDVKVTYSVNGDKNDE